MTTSFVGIRNLQVQDQAKGISFPALTMYPTQTPSSPKNFGPYSLDVSPEARVDGRSLPVVILSHGNGSNPLVYRNIAHFLAKSGYIVAMPEHPGNNTKDNPLEGTLENLENRPRHVELTIDAVYSDPQLRDHAQADQVAVIGHSMGGYTALAVAGGQPWWAPGQKVTVSQDSRVKALVLMAPAASWFVPNDSLGAVKVPILLYAAERDVVTPRWNSQLILDLVPDQRQISFNFVANAGHFSFLSPFPPSMQRPDFPPSLDPPGFDREAFQVRLTEEMRVFLDSQLSH